MSGRGSFSNLAHELLEDVFERDDAYPIAPHKRRARFVRESARRGALEHWRLGVMVASTSLVLFLLFALDGG